jgi:MFS family permease
MYNHRSVFLAACCGMMLFGICLITLGSLAIDLRSRFQLSGIDSGSVFAILPFGILTGSLVFGPVGDRHGYRLLLVVACLGMFAGFEGIVHAGTVGMLKVFIYLFGISGGIVNGATNALVANISPEHKGAQLSLLGVSFGLGALGMPLLLGLLSRSMSSFEVVSGIGWLAFFVGMILFFIRFPKPDLSSKGNAALRPLLNDTLIWTIAFFLFLQSSLEAIVNNWTTSYLQHRGLMSDRLAWYALSIHIVGMVVMRLLTGTLLRAFSLHGLTWLSLAFIALGMVMMQYSPSQVGIVAGLFLSGAGLAGGFPIMLGFVGDHAPDKSGTAFSFVFTVALAGNILVNYLMGIVVDRFGVSQLPFVSYLEVALMVILFHFISRKLTSSSK